MRGIVAFVAVAGCSTEYRISPVSPTEPVHGAVAPIGGAADDPLAPPPSDPLGTPSLETQQVVLGGGARADVADYLFVLDSSSSMQQLLDKVLDGFDALSHDEAFPKDARIGVMNMTPADPLRPTQVHPAVHADRWWLRFDPGFGGLVDGDRITVFKELAPAYVAERFPVAGCGAWFAPDEKNEDGVPCLVANTQIALYPVGVEAGLTALSQRLEADPPLFRSGAAANVIFVTDTHDPGLPPTDPGFGDLMSIRPTFAQLETLALSHQPLASFRVHAIAPATVCTAEDWTAAGPAYFEAAKASGGQTLDSCTASPAQYVELVRQIATQGAVPQRAVIAVHPDMDIAQVLVDGEPVPFKVSSDGRALTLPGDLPTEQRHVDVRFRRRY
jgi:hypothetical protein